MSEANMVDILPDKPNSVEFSVNAKGLWSGKVKVYSDTIKEAYESAYEKAGDMSRMIKEKNGI